MGAPDFEGYDEAALENDCLFHARSMATAVAEGRFVEAQQHAREFRAADAALVKLLGGDPERDCRPTSG